VLKAVLDTNVLISALFWRGAPYHCLVATQAGIFQLIICEEITIELEKVLVHKFEFTSREAKEAADFLKQHGHEVPLREKVRIIKDDPDDDKFIQAALAGKAEIVVSGDRHLLRLGNCRGIKIIGVNEFLKQILG